MLKGFNVTREQLNQLRLQLHNRLNFQDLHIMNFDTFILNYEHKGNDYCIVIDRDGVQRMPLHYMIPVAEANETHLLIDFYKEVI